MSKPEPRDGRTPVAAGVAAQSQELIDPKWLFKAGAITVAAAAVVAYCIFCLLFYQGQWQIVLHPGPMQPVPGKLLPPHEDFRFAVNDAGHPTMHGWWVPADHDTARPNDVLVYFPGGSGALSSRVLRITYLHQQQLAVFAFDYRGFGDSKKLHPSQLSIAQDALAAVQYLTQTRHIPLAHMIFYGEGIGCFAALRAADANPGVAAVILSDPQMSQLPVFESDGRARLLPLHLLLRDDFSLQPELSGLHARTLVLATTPTQECRKSSQDVYDAISAPKAFMQASLGAGALGLTADLDAFLEQVFPLPGVSPAAPESHAATNSHQEK